MPHGITRCYLPPGRADIPALTPAEAGTWLSDPSGSKAELTCLLYPVLQSVNLSSVGGRAFPVAGPTICNCLPDNVISAPSLSTFCHRLKHFCSRHRFLTLSLIPSELFPASSGSWSDFMTKIYDWLVGRSVCVLYCLVVCCFRPDLLLLDGKWQSCYFCHVKKLLTVKGTGNPYSVASA